MERKSIFHSFLDIEEKNDIFEIEVDGAPLWERLRFSIYRKIMVESGISAQPHSKMARTLSRRMQNYGKLIKEIVNPTYRNVSRSDILFFGHSRRKKMEDGKWWDIYCDPIINALDRSYVYLESPYLGNHLIPARTESMVYSDGLILRGESLSGIRAKYLKIDPEVNETLNRVREEIHNRFGVDIDLIKIAKKDIARRKGLLPLYSKLLDAIQPQLVVVVVGYGKEIFIEACKTKQIPVVELQHGVVTSQHLAYTFPGKYRKKLSFPDYFFTFGDYWATLAEYPIAQSRVIPVGFPYFDMETSRVSKESRRKQIVFLSQGSAGKEMSRIAVELRGLLSDGWEVIYKLHPGEYNRWETLYPWIIDSKVIVIDDDSVPLYDLLSQSLVQVGISSTAIYEGLGLGTKTIILDLSESENMRSLFDQGYVKMVDNATDLANIVEDVNSFNFPSEEFFKPNAIENIKRQLDKVIQEQSTTTSAVRQ